MNKPKRQLVPRDFDMGTKTKAQFFGQFRSAFRKLWMFSKVRQEVVRRARKAPNQYECNHCHNLFKSAEIEVNHVKSAGSLREFEDFTPFVSRMFTQDLNELEVVCKACHLVYSNKERKS